jgi:hypothetical protein
MTYYLQQALDIVLIVFAIGQFIVLISIVAVFDRDNKHEIVLRVLAVICGILLYVVARAVRLPLLEMIANTMSQLPERYSVYLDKYAILFAILLSFVIAIALSSSVSRYIINHTRIEETGDRAISTRLMCLVITLVLLLYSDLYLSFGVQGVETMEHLKPLLPDVIFILSTLMFAIFRLRPSKTPTPNPVQSV